MAELAPQPTSVQSIYSWFRETKLYVNRRYQRKLVWTLEEKKRLIESISKRYPVPAIILAERAEESGTFEIIDGLQRLHTIVSYIENYFPDIEGNFFNVEEFATAKRASAEGIFARKEADLITAKEVTNILDYVLPISIMRDASDQEIDDVFGRINTYGHRLSDQERRQAGVDTEFATMVREIASSIRGDVSENSLPLYGMPAISIDLPKTKHGYSVQADEVFWVQHGILTSTDLRDSMDEQSVADIAACIVGGAPIDRSKEALDAVYEDENERNRLENAVAAYGGERFSEEFLHCIEVIEGASAAKGQKLRNLVFKSKTTNAYPSVFAPIFIAIHSLAVGGKAKVIDSKILGDKLDSIAEKISVGKSFTAASERRSNIDAVKGMLADCFVSDPDFEKKVYNNHSAIDIENSVRRSVVELAAYELKQGIVRLDGSNAEDPNCIPQVLATIAGMANIGAHSSGKIIIGVANKEADATRITQLFGTTPKEVGGRFVVGVSREASALAISPEQYIQKWRDAVSNSQLSEPLKSQVLNNLDFNNYYGLGVLMIAVPPQKEMATYENRVFERSGDQTVEVTDVRKIGDIARRF